MVSSEPRTTTPVGETQCHGRSRRSAGRPGHHRVGPASSIGSQCDVGVIQVKSCTKTERTDDANHRVEITITPVGWVGETTKDDPQGVQATTTTTEFIYI